MTNSPMEAIRAALKIMKSVIAYKTLLTRDEAKAVIAALEAAASLPPIADRRAVLEEAAKWFIETFKTEARFYPNEVAAYLCSMPLASPAPVEAPTKEEKEL